MDDDRIVEFERALWIGDGDVYRRRVSDDCLMVVPERPFLLRGATAIQSVEHTPRWLEVDFADFEVNRARDGLIVIGYHAEASRPGERYTAFCTSTYQKTGDRDWVVIQHQQTPASAAEREVAANAIEEAQKAASEEREEARGYQGSYQRSDPRHR